MAERPIFVPAPSEPEMVREISLPIVWNPGFSAVQKKKNIKALHAAAAAAGYAPLLEISTKSDRKVGRHLSAFHLKVHTSQSGDIPLECAFQGSKVFERGGPFTDLFSTDPKSAKRDPRLSTSGPLIGFKFENLSFPLQPKTVFYDWLYVNAIYPHREWLKILHGFAGFTDIEFNPERSLNCQARSCALFVALMSKNLLETAVESPNAFIALLSGHAYRPHHDKRKLQEALFVK
jgi:hypothetical protein